MGSSSSIFNFEALRAAARLPLRAHAWHALLALGAMGVFGAASSQLHYKAPPGRNPRDLSSLAKAELMLLGNSQMDSISNEHYAYPSVSLALGGTGYRCENALLYEFAPKAPKLRVVLLGFDNIPLRVTDIEERVGDFSDLEAVGLPWYRVPVRWRERFRYAVHYNPMLRNVFLGKRLGIEQLGRWSFLQKAEAAERSAAPAQSVFARIPGYSNARVEGWGKIGSYMNRYRDEKVRKMGLEAFYGILSYCDAHKIAVVLVRLPTTRAFHGGRLAAWDEEIFALLDDARQRYPRLALPVWDAEDILDLPLEDFSDPNHLGPVGAKKTADFLNERLRQSPYADDSRSLFASRRSTLLISADPREDAWKGMVKSDENVSPASAPMDLAGVSTPAFRVTLRSGEVFYAPSPNPVSAGATADASIWLWTSSPATTDIYLMLGPAESMFQTAASTHVLELGDQPKEFKLSYTFAADSTASRLEFINRAKTDLTFFMAAPSIRLRAAR